MSKMCVCIYVYTSICRLYSTSKVAPDCGMQPKGLHLIPLIDETPGLVSDEGLGFRYISRRLLEFVESGAGRLGWTLKFGGTFFKGPYCLCGGKKDYGLTLLSGLTVATLSPLIKKMCSMIWVVKQKEPERCTHQHILKAGFPF